MPSLSDAEADRAYSRHHSSRLGPGLEHAWKDAGLSAHVRTTCTLVLTWIRTDICTISGVRTRSEVESVLRRDSKLNPVRSTTTTTVFTSANSATRSASRGVSVRGAHPYSPALPKHEASVDGPHLQRQHHQQAHSKPLVHTCLVPICVNSSQYTLFRSRQ